VQNLRLKNVTKMFSAKMELSKIDPT
jgi:hypothetical protein